MDREHRRGQIAAARDKAKQDLTDAQNRLTDAGYAAKALGDKAAGVNAELISLREHPNNIPKRQLDLRAWMCRELRLDEQALPFAGELIAVRPQEADWEGAAERVLRGFALSVLVPEQHYAAVSDWIDGYHLKARVVYYRVPDPAREGHVPPPNWSPGSLAAKLDIRDTPFARAGRIRGEVSAALAESDCEPARMHFEAITSLLAQGTNAPPCTAEACDKAENAASEQISTLIDRRTTRRSALGNKIVSLMGEFRAAYPVETGELDAAVEAADGYRELHQRLTDDDLPRFQHQFKTYLNQNTIRDIAGFQSQLNKQAEVIRQRIDTINQSLVGVDYNPGRYIKLEAQPSPHVDIRDFRSDLRACTEGAVSAETSDQYSEQKFLQVSRIIERLRGREGQTDADRRWTRFVTDVRNWDCSC